KGRLAEPDEIVAAAEAILRPEGPLRGQRVLVAAGPTYEDFDPVRYIGNRSSGRMGYAIAAEAARRGADVTLVTGPAALEVPHVREVVKVRSAAEMHEAVISRAASMHVVVMAAAVTTTCMLAAREMTASCISAALRTLTTSRTCGTSSAAGPVTSVTSAPRR